MNQDEKREIWLLKSSDQIITGIHPKKWCSKQCVVHRPSDHSMRHLPLAFDMVDKCFYRVCEHGIKHQDPDEREYWIRELGRSTSHKERGTRLLETALKKLGGYACPGCSCGCCSPREL